MNIPSTINSAPALRDFGIAAKKDEAVALKKDGLQAQPAKQGFFGRIMQWVRGENPARINSDTKEAFVAAMTRRFGSKAADTALAKTGFHMGNDQPLTSREIKRAIGYAKLAEGQGAGSGSAAAGAVPASRASGQAQALQGTMKEMRNTQAETAGLANKATKLSQLAARLRATGDERLGAVQAKLAETKQLWAQARGKLDGQIAQVNQLAAGASPAAADTLSAQPSAGKPNAVRSAAQEQRAQVRERNAEARSERNEQRAAAQAEHKQNLQQLRQDNQQMREDMRTQAKLAREQSRAEMAEHKQAQRDERQAATAQHQADRAQQRELRAQARLEHKAEAREQREAMGASAQALVARTSHMVDQEFAALQAEIDEFSAKADAFSAALARPIAAN